jgi:type IV pilus assembly protein PilZ
VWITPQGAQGNRVTGIGVQFTESAEAEIVKGKIETLLAGILDSDKPTHTM